MQNQEKKLYCSLDIETSGFDPATADILEVGFAFFSVSTKGLKITEEYTQVFRPTREVPANILGLTGIAKAELESAPLFAEHRDYIQEKLQKATIVGHNVIFDIKFLQSLGLSFEGEIIDTLEIAQFVLPTHHSYNLENLMHIFRVEHKDAHRALADSKAAVQLLEKMLRVFSGFPSELKNQICDLIKNLPLPWKELLRIEMTGIALPLKERPPILPKPFYKKLKFKSNFVYNFPLGGNCAQDAAFVLQEQQDKTLLVVPRLQQVGALWESGLARAFFPSEFQFDEQKFEKLLKSKNLSPEEAKFLLKVLVWRQFNWQKEAIIDLNLSFSGGQFKNLITGGKTAELKSPQVVAADLPTFMALSRQGLYKKRILVVVGLNDFESAVSAGISSKVAWGFINYHLKYFYNPETRVGDEKFKEPVESLLSSSDLFFGLVNALLQTDPPTFQYYKITPEAIAGPQYQKIKQAALHFTSKINEFNPILKSEELKAAALNLAAFFEEQDNYVKWIELAANRCVFFSSPLDISKVVEELLSPYGQVVFVDSLGSDKLMEYYIQRLGLTDFKVENVAKEPDKKSVKQTELFHKAVQTLPLPTFKRRHEKIKFYCRAESWSTEELVEIIEPKSLPAAILFGTASQVKGFYEQYYEALKTFAFLVTQNTSGGSGKMFRNFSIYPNSLLLATDKFVLKHKNNNGGLNLVENISVKTLILGHLPFEQYTHPYQEALSTKFSHPFEEYSLPKALYNLHCLINFFHSPELEKIYLYDSKLAKGYGQKFIEYIKQFPDLELQK